MSDVVGVAVDGEVLKAGSMPTEEFNGILNAAQAAIPMEVVNKPREIAIRQAANGYMVQVGCETFVFETAERMIDNVSLYIKNPKEMERVFHAGELFEFQKSK